MLARAFGPVDEPYETGDLDPDRVLDFGRRMSLLSRIRSRNSEERLRQELGDQIVEALGRDYYSNVASVMTHEVGVRDVAQVSSRAGFSIILLKGMALHYLERLVAGSRRLADIDILVPVKQCEPLYEALLEAGFTASGIAAPDHHLSMMFHPLGSALEIHHSIDGVRFDGEACATADSCLKGGHVQNLPGFPDHCYLPSEPLLLAHLLAHGLGHHGKAPDSYPPFQLLADLQDCGVARQEGNDLGHVVEGWVSRDLRSPEVRATVELTRRLSNGERGSDIACEDSDGSTLIRHFLAGTLDPAYLESLRLSRRLDARPGRGRPESILGTVWGALWLTNLQIERLYGKPRSNAGYFGYRLWRPFDLMIRLVRYSRSWLVTRYRGWRGRA